MSYSISTDELLLEYTLLLKKYGADSNEVKSFVSQHKDNKEFVDLAQTVANLKNALIQRRGKSS